MTTKEETAYPTPLSHFSKGLTKREYFAALAMQGYVSADYTANSGTPVENMAEFAVKMADALIIELNKPSNPTL